jgi:hypothetical protein
MGSDQLKPIFARRQILRFLAKWMTSVGMHLKDNVGLIVLRLHHSLVKHSLASFSLLIETVQYYARWLNENA